jgi:hypothetical protein
MTGAVQPPPPPAPPPPFLIFSNPLSLSSHFSSPSHLWVYHCPLWVFCRPLWVSLHPLWWFAGPLGGLRLLDDSGFLMWLGLSLWHMVWGLLPTRTLPHERFRSESLLLYPPCLRLDLFKHLIVVCSYAQIAWPLMPWLNHFKHQIIRSVEDWFSVFVVPTCHLLIWTS